MSKLNWRKTACAVFLVCATTAIALPAQTFHRLQSFDDGVGGGSPYSALVQATNGSLFGTTSGGGANLGGTVFKITPGGTLATLYSFCSQSGCTDGASPFYGALIQGADGNFYGTTADGGANNSALCFNLGCGTVFKITPSGTLTTLYSFCSLSGCTDGAEPLAGLVQAADGNFYGTTLMGGAVGDCQFFAGCGTIFKITPSGTLTTLYSFCAQNGCADGLEPEAALVQATDGDLYGTTYAGGANTLRCGGLGCGTVFKTTPAGTLTTLYSFCPQTGCLDGANPLAALVQTAGGNFYGTTVGGGATFNGTVFQITPNGTLATLHNFCQGSCADGRSPAAALVRATDGSLYGTALFGGLTNDDGTVFKITPNGTLTLLHSFIGHDGRSPNALIQDTNGEFYGTASSGGASNGCFDGQGCGTVFSLSVGLGPFVETRRTFGKVGMAVKILGTNLIGATSVTFNGTAATFTVKSRSLITTTVPAGATTGTVQVVTPHGTLSSNVPFRVLP